MLFIIIIISLFVCLLYLKFKNKLYWYYSDLIFITIVLGLIIYLNIFYFYHENTSIQYNKSAPLLNLSDSTNNYYVIFSDNNIWFSSENAHWSNNNKIEIYPKDKFEIIIDSTKTPQILDYWTITKYKKISNYILPFGNKTNIKSINTLNNYTIILPDSSYLYTIPTK